MAIGGPVISICGGMLSTCVTCDAAATALPALSLATKHSRTPFSVVVKTKGVLGLTAGLVRVVVGTVVVVQASLDV